MFTLIVNQILKMLLLMLLGCVCYRLKFIDQNGNKMLSNLLLMIVNPILAIVVLQTDYSPHLVSGLLTAYLLAFLTHGVMVIVSTLLIRNQKDPDCCIDRFSSMYANCGFMGIPLVQSILGNEGVLYLTAYMTVFNLFSWTHGIIIMTGKTTRKDLQKGLLSPMIIASILGLVLFFLQIRLPAVLGDAMTYVSNMNTPLAMMIAGISVAQTDFSKMLKNRKLYFTSAVKLLLMPALVLAGLAVAQVDSTVACTTLIAAACPVAATGTAFALRFHKNYKYSSELYAFTTIASLATIPLFVYAAERLLL